MSTNARDLRRTAWHYRFLAGQTLSPEVAQMLMRNANDLEHRADETQRMEVQHLVPQPRKPPLLARCRAALRRSLMRHTELALAGQPELGLWLMHKMMDRVGIDRVRASAVAGGAIMQQMAGTCLECGKQGACRRWLGQSGDGQGYRSFCPNSARMGLLLETQHAA